MTQPSEGRKVPKEFTEGADQHNAGKAWLEGYDTAARELRGCAFCEETEARAERERDELARATAHEMWERTSTPPSEGRTTARRIIDEAVQENGSGEEVFLGEGYACDEILVAKITAVIERAEAAEREHKNIDAQLDVIRQRVKLLARLYLTVVVTAACGWMLYYIPEVAITALIVVALVLSALAAAKLAA